MMILSRKPDGPITAARPGDGLYDSYMRTDRVVTEDSHTNARSPPAFPAVSKHTGGNKPAMKDQQPTGVRGNQVKVRYLYEDSSKGKANAPAKTTASLSKEKSLDSTCSVRSGDSTDRPGKVEPLTPEQALKLHGQQLTVLEQQEILAYPEVYFLGPNAKKRPAAAGGSNNNGFDDDQGGYIHVPHDHLAYRYEFLKVIGKGSFGQVAKVYDHKTRQHLALKMVRNEKRFHRQAAEEIRILEHLRKQDKTGGMNVVHMLESFTFRGHICMTFELLSMNLYELIKRNKFQGFSLPLVRKFGLSILQCLESLQRSQIIHCDLKPENILLKQPGRSGIKVIDFGSSCYEHQRVYTYIQSRFYRAPEVILGARYGMPIDMWSLGCILAELLTGYPLFPGEDEGDQLACMMELLGLPPQKLLEQSKRAKNFISSKGQPRYCTTSTLSGGGVVLNGGRSRRGKLRGPPGSRDWASVLKGCDDAIFIDFLRKCLDWDPAARLTPAQALRHPWLFKRLPKPLVGDRTLPSRRAADHSSSFPSIMSKLPPALGPANSKLRTAMMGDGGGGIPLRTVLPKLVT
ncbi:dual specificity tyrosine-phosphorylation-regulated kinase 3 isoform X1 [Anguilla anguilla]|uniref:dual specificity tyrosine-phosphorylation-regulated kinase 3 isoform X1 n=2 Tax=Anguilla anguilla TaxID=7936 RepID=UPI0015B0B9FB|nr:dual specificity tyrosine-phosphorylation-regulated kinase 3 isoform X1 [Anguilla anguilla]